MNLKKLKNKTILLFGKSRAFSVDEFAMQLKSHNISILREYNNEEIDLIVDGAMMTPLENIESEKLYDEKKYEFIEIDKLEQMLIDDIDEDSLLMSLKLSHDKERLKDFLTNDKVSKTLFLKLLKMYEWGDDDFFENNDNRDVTAALIGKFYKNIQRNHNVQFSKLGLMHLVLQSVSEDVIKTIAYLKPLQKSFLANDKEQNYKIITSLATHFATPKDVLKMFIKKSNTYVHTLIAMRENCDEELQELLYAKGEFEVNEALSYSQILSNSLFNRLSKHDDFSKHMAKFIKLDEDRFMFFKDTHPAMLAQNESLTYDMQEALTNYYQNNVSVALAQNKSLSPDLITKFLTQKDEKINFAIYSNSSTPDYILTDAYDNVINHFALANNESTPSYILHHLAKNGDIKILHALAKNKSTPVEILYQLQLDSRLERAVKENPSFGEYIKTENMGWL